MIEIQRTDITGLVNEDLISDAMEESSGPVNLDLTNEAHIKRGDAVSPDCHESAKNSTDINGYSVSSSVVAGVEQQTVRIE